MTDHNRVTQQLVDDIVTEGLNTVYDKLGKHGDDPNIIEYVKKAAEDYITLCVTEGAEEIEYSTG